MAVQRNGANIAARTLKPGYVKASTATTSPGFRSAMTVVASPCCAPLTMELAADQVNLFLALGGGWEDTKR